MIIKRIFRNVIITFQGEVEHLIPHLTLWFGRSSMAVLKVISFTEKLM